MVALYTGLALSGVTALALTESNPYGAIAGRNVFALKPPTPTPSVAVTAPTVPPNIELQGFTTILGRAQVLLKIKTPPRPPEPAKDRSLVMDIGQREGDVEVLEMDAYAGVVKLKNQGNLISLNLKDNAARPAAGPALTLPAAAPAAGMLPPPTQPQLPARPSVGATPSTTPVGGGSPLPTRAVRSAPMTKAQEAEDRNFRETQVALMEVEREINKDNPKYPPLPPTAATPAPAPPGP